MAKRRRFTPQFKAEVVIEALMGQGSQARTVSQAQHQSRTTIEVETPTD